MTKHTFGLILFFLAACCGGRAQTHKHTTWVQNASTASVVAAAFTATSTTGNLILAHFSYDSQTKSITAVTDSKSNVYARINGPTNWDGTMYRSELWYSYNITGGTGNITVTGKLSGTTAFFQTYISEYSGILSTSDPLDQSGTQKNGGNPVSSATKTLAYSNELLYAIAIGASGSLTPGSSFNARSAGNDNVVEDKSIASAGANTASFTTAGGNWVVDMASFRTTSSSTPLPIELMKFEANAASPEAVTLNWLTATEEQNAYFAVERSADGCYYAELAEIAGAGTSSTMHQYGYTDDHPLEGPAYYRLKQTDFNKKFTYSSVCTVDLSRPEAPELLCYPNPAQEQLSVEGSAMELSAAILTNSLGQELAADRSWIDNNNSQRLLFDLRDLEPGIYYIRGKTQSKRFVKAR